MTPGDVVDFCRFGQHRAVVLAVDPRGFVIIQCTSHQRGDGGVEVPPRERVGAWARARQITEAAAAILFPAPPPDAS